MKVAKQVVLHIGSQNDDGDYYAAMDGSKEVHVISADTIKELIGKKASDFIDNEILSGTLSNAKSIDVTIGSDSWHLAKEEVAESETEAETEEKWYEGDKEIALTDLSSLFTVIFPVVLRRRSLIQRQNQPGMRPSVSLSREDDTETTISFTAYDSSFHLAEINGEARKLVNKRDVEKLVEDMTALLKK